MRVAFFMNNFILNGAETVFLNLAREFKKKNIEVCFVLLEDTFTDEKVKKEFDIYICKGRNILQQSRNLMNLVTSNSITTIISGLEPANSIACLCKLRNRKINLVVTEHNNFIREEPSHIVIRKIILYRFSDVIVGVSKGVSRLCKKILFTNPKKILTIYNPVISDKKKKYPKPKEFTAKRNFIIIGRLCKQKNQQMAINAFAKAQLSSAKLFVMGQGPDEQKLKRLCKRLHVEDRVIFTGYIKNPYPYMQHAEALIMTSKWEGFGNVIVESLHYGTPVIARDCKYGPREIRQFGFNVTLFNNNNNNNNNELCKNIKNIIKKNKNKNSKNIEMFNLKNNTNKYITLVK